jgi:oxygen-independent coproporphyrinogen III oxidase
MAGIYLHIPFCKQACNYCNFHFSTSLRKKEDLLRALKQELILQKDYVAGEKIETIYFGGGTPSILEVDELQKLIDTIFTLHEVNKDAEITIEANPDDLSRAKLVALKQHTPINRFSIGVQSFFEEDLKFMNRAHNSEEAKRCIKTAQDVGFQNLTIDLIYGTPTMSNEQWRENLSKAIAFDIPHISSYCLTVEPKTPLEKQVKKGLRQAINDEQAAVQFEILMQTLENEGFEHYEISNFSKPNQHARHNSNYWLGKKYLGIGPSAHSFNGNSRQHNIANNQQYIDALAGNRLNFELENLNIEERYNEYILTTLRTKWGTNLSNIAVFGDNFLTHFKKNITPFVVQQQVIEKDGNYQLSRSGKLLADYITVALFWEDERTNF